MVDIELKKKVDELTERLAEKNQEYRQIYLEVEEAKLGKTKKTLVIRSMDGDAEATKKLQEEDRRIILLEEKKKTIKIQRDELQRRYNEAKQAFLVSQLDDFKVERRKLKAKFKKALKELDEMFEDLENLSRNSNDASNYANEPKLFILEAFSDGGVRFEKFKDWVEFYFNNK